MNKLAAEKELLTTRKGTFLVWKSRSPYDLYLSYHDTVVHHLPIKQLGRFFFLEGAKFRSLSDLVVHHLTMREFSHNPVKIVNSHKREKLEATHIALLDMEYLSRQPAFCVNRGDLLAEVGRIDDRWLLAKHLPSENIAFFDMTQTSILSDLDARMPQALPYFCAGEDQEQLVHRLTEGGRGSFLIRQSRQASTAYALLVHTGDKIDKFLLEEDDKGVPSSLLPSHKINNNNNNNGLKSAKSSNGSFVNGWRLSGRVFTSISSIVHRYSIRPIQGEVRLTHAILSPLQSVEMCPAESLSISSPFPSSAAMSSAEESGNTREMQECDRGAGERLVVASLSSLYKNREDKVWRECTVTLYEHSGIAILRVGDTARGDCHSLILHHTELVCLHESIFGREATVFLSPLQRRMEVVSSSSSPVSYYSGAGGQTTEMSLLTLHVDKYKGALLKPETPYKVDISMNGVGIANTPYQTPTTGSSSVVFDAHFLLIVTSWSCDVQFTISASGKSRPTAVSSVFNVPVGSMISSSSSSSSSTSTATAGVERKVSNVAPATPFIVTSSRQRVIVLSRDSYTPLMDSLLDEVISVAEWASGRLPAPQRNLLCSVVVSLVWPHSLRALVERTLGKNIHETSGENMLRQDSFASCLFTAALRMSGKTILEAKLAEEQSRNEGYTEEWLVGLLSEVARVPAVSLVLACVAATVAAHLSIADKEHVVRRAISATFVLRFANPLIISALASSGGPALARGVQTAANAATMRNFVRDTTREGTATRLFDLFERVRHSTVQTVTVEAYDRAPEQCALLCHLIVLAFNGPANCLLPATSSIVTSSSSSSSTVTTSSGSSMTLSTLGGTESAVATGTETGLSISLSTVSSSSSSSASHGHPELTPCLARLLQLHRS